MCTTYCPCYSSEENKKTYGKIDSQILEKFNRTNEIIASLPKNENKDKI